MKIPSFFRTPGHRVFDLKPRYYNPTRERLGEAGSRNDTPDQAEQSKARIRYHFEARKKIADPVSAKQSTIRVAIITVLLALFILWLFR